jgi:hypothetical protein
VGFTTSGETLLVGAAIADAVWAVPSGRLIAASVAVSSADAVAAAEAVPWDALATDGSSP